MTETEAPFLKMADFRARFLTPPHETTVRGWASQGMVAVEWGPAQYPRYQDPLPEAKKILRTCDIPAFVAAAIRGRRAIEGMPKTRLAGYLVRLHRENGQVSQRTVESWRACGHLRADAILNGLCLYDGASVRAFVEFLTEPDPHAL